MAVHHSTTKSRKRNYRTEQRASHKNCVGEEENAQGTLIVYDYSRGTQKGKKVIRDKNTLPTPMLVMRLTQAITFLVMTANITTMTYMNSLVSNQLHLIMFYLIY